MDYLRKLLLLNFFLLIFFQNINAQFYQKFGVNQLIETKWRYAYMLHLQSGMVIHKADQDYNYFVYFKADYSFEQFLNGNLSKGVWAYTSDRLQYQFKDIIDFSVVIVDEDRLILEFTRANSRGHFQYHFTNAIEKNPFIKPSNELPIVTVKEKRFFNIPNWMSGLRDKKNTSIKKESTYINIELVGGGYYGGIDPVLKDMIHIKTDGRLIKEFQTKGKGLNVVKKNIPREELEKFCEFATAQGFFNFDREYDCTDEVCEYRKRQKPLPMPLRLAITYGTKKKVITIKIWGNDERRTRYVNYPPVLDNIIDNIQRFAFRIES